MTGKINRLLGFLILFLWYTASTLSFANTNSPVKGGSRNPYILATGNEPVARLSASPLSSRNPYILATGNEGGFYYAFGCAVSNAAERNGIAIRVLPTNGSAENLAKLLAGQVDICLTQSDVAYDCLHGTGSFETPATNLVAIAPMYTEPMHILVRDKLNLRRIQDFEGKRVDLGAYGSGTEIVARRMLDAAGLSISQVVPQHNTISNALVALGKQEVDIIFLMSGYPLERINPVLEKQDAYLFEPNIDVCERLVSEHTYLVSTTIPKRTYPNQPQAVATIGIETLMVSRSDVDPRLHYVVAEAVDLCKKKMIQPYTLPSTTRNFGISAIAPFSSSALDYYKKAGILRRCAMQTYIVRGVIIIITMGLLWGLIKLGHPQKWRRSHFASISFSALLLLSVWTIGSLVLYMAERRINDSYGTIFQSFWSSLVNWVSFGQKEPYTVLGRTTTAAMAGLGVGGLFFFGNRIWTKVKTMKRNYSDHYNP